MTQTKRVVTMVALAVVIIGGVAVGVTKMLNRPPKPPTWLLDEPMSLIDEKTLVIVSKPRGAWGERQGQLTRYKNPETGEYTMAPIILCFACEQEVPMPADLSKEDALSSYVCPKCSKKAH